MLSVSNVCCLLSVGLPVVVCCCRQKVCCVVLSGVSLTTHNTKEIQFFFRNETETIGCGIDRAGV